MSEEKGMRYCKSVNWKSESLSFAWRKTWELWNDTSGRFPYGWWLFQQLTVGDTAALIYLYSCLSLFTLSCMLSLLHVNMLFSHYFFSNKLWIYMEHLKGKCHLSERGKKKDLIQGWLEEERLIWFQCQNCRHSLVQSPTSVANLAASPCQANVMWVGVGM